MHPYFTVEVQIDGEVTVLRLQGELDLATVETLRLCTDAVLQDGRDIVFDLSNLVLLDASGIRHFLDVRSRLAADRQVILRNPRGVVDRALQATGVLDNFVVQVSD